MSLSHLADLACTKQPFAAGSDAQQTTSDTDDSCSSKRVRFDIDANDDADLSMAVDKKPMASSSEEVKRLIERVRRRAVLRKRYRRRRSPSPPRPSTNIVLGSTSWNPIKSSCNADVMDDLDSLQERLRRMENAIKNSARTELELMNKSRKLHDARARLTHRYEAIVAKLVKKQLEVQTTSLPPLLTPVPPMQLSKQVSNVIHAGHHLASPRLLSSFIPSESMQSGAAIVLR